MKRKITSTLVLSLLIQLASFAQPEPLTADDAAIYFKEIKAICDKDNGSLWGKSLWSPTLFIDYRTHKIMANVNDSKGSFTADKGVYTGCFPEDKILANSTTELDGMKWVMVILPLPEDEYVRNQLVVHEMFHYLQDELGLTPKNGYDNNHIDEMDARIYLKLEWSALNKAILANNDVEKKAALRDALIFRAYRRLLYPQAALSENRFEMHEGLPEYTSHKLCAPIHLLYELEWGRPEYILRTDSKEGLKQKLLQSAKVAWDKESYVRSFGYYSGFAYAYFLDGSDWQKGLSPDTDLAKLVQKHYNITLPANVDNAQKDRRSIYGYQEIYDIELALKQKKDKIHAENKQKFEDGSKLTFSLQNPHVGFNPNNLQAYGNKGTVYPTMNVIDSWGTLTVNGGGCLLSNNWKEAIVSAENIQVNGIEAKGDGWELKLNDGYTLAREGQNYVVTSEK